MNNLPSRSPHILNTSATLLGFCFVVLTSSKITKLDGGSYIEEGATLAIVCFMGSCLLSFLAIKSRVNIKVSRYEQIADILFLCGLVILFLITILIAFNVI